MVEKKINILFCGWDTTAKLLFEWFLWVCDTGTPWREGTMLGPVFPFLEGNQGIVQNFKNPSLEKLNLFGLYKKKWGGLGPGGREERENNFFF